MHTHIFILGCPSGEAQNLWTSHDQPKMNSSSSHHHLPPTCSPLATLICPSSHLPLTAMRFHSQQPLPAPLISLTNSCSSFKNHFPMEVFPTFPFLQPQQFEYSQPFKIMMLKNVSQLYYGQCLHQTPSIHLSIHLLITYLHVSGTAVFSSRSWGSQWVWGIPLLLACSVVSSWSEWVLGHL